MLLVPLVEFAIEFLLVWFFKSKQGISFELLMLFGSEDSFEKRFPKISYFGRFVASFLIEYFFS
jgi:hypothetical protein